VTAGELAATYLNLCAIFSSLNRHYDAIRTSMRAIQLIKKCLPKSLREFKRNRSPTDEPDETEIKAGQSEVETKTAREEMLDLFSSIDLNSEAGN